MCSTPVPNPDLPVPAGRRQRRRWRPSGTLLRPRRPEQMADTAVQQLPVARSSSRVGAFVRRYRLAPYLLLVPALAGIALVYLWPLAQMVLYSFQNFGLPQLTGAAPVQWVGLANFSTTFADPEFWLSLRITVFFAAVAVPLTLVSGTVVGLLLNR